MMPAWSLKSAWPLKPAWSYPLRCVLIGLAASVVAVLLAQTSLMQAVDLKLGDTLASLTAPATEFDDVLVIDVDEASMKALEPQIGPWPYNRDVYALVNQYLLQSGAAVVAYDILFSESRRGDAEFAATLSPKVVLPVSALPYGSAGQAANYDQRLAAMAWAYGDGWPAKVWSDLTLPLDIFSDRARVGVISLEPDLDGVLRRVPLLHSVHGQVLPSLAAAVLKETSGSLMLDTQKHQLAQNGMVLPQDAQHLVALRYPRQLQLRIVPFYQVALAASGNAKYTTLADSIRGKTVYIGSSSAVLGDFIQTPLGRMAGLYVVAAVPSMLQRGMVFKPSSKLWDGLLAAVLLALALLVAHPRLQRSTALQISLLPALVTFAALAVLAANLLGYRLALLLPLTAALLAHLTAMVWRQFHLFKKSQELLVAKLAAEESNRLKSQFLSRMTHELRTPLTAILGFNNINWKSNDIGASERISNGAVIARNGQHLLALINGILDQAKLEAGQVHIARQSESVRAVVNDVVLTLQPLLQDRPIALQADFAPGLIDELELDAFRLRQILLNLAGNALKFTPAGQVTLKVDWHDGELSVAVQDTGPGLSEAALAKLFVAFQQADDSVAATHGGTGLGLVISQNLAQLMQGGISVVSEPGNGSCFTLRIAAQPGKTRSDTVNTTDASTGRADSGAVATPLAEVSAGALRGTVLVADDAPDLRALTVLHLKRLGLTVLQAQDGQQAVDIALQALPNAILMDMEMPLLHGLEAVKILRAKGFSAPILAMTAHAGEPHRTLALAAGCNDVLAKPVKFSVLRAVLDGALASSTKKQTRP
jgi:signal transduction histidine kinase/ActR/RegA family two-component response regulator